MKHDSLTQMQACDDTRRWWDAYERGDRLLWYAAEVGADYTFIVRAACACARLALQYVPDGEDRPRIAIETAEAWCDGRVTIDEVRAAHAAAYAADAIRKKCADVVRQHIPFPCPHGEDKP